MGKWSKKVLEKTGFRETKITFYCLKSFWNESGIKKKKKWGDGEGRQRRNRGGREWETGNGELLIGFHSEPLVPLPHREEGFPMLLCMWLSHIISPNLQCVFQKMRGCKTMWSDPSPAVHSSGSAGWITSRTALSLAFPPHLFPSKSLCHKFLPKHQREAEGADQGSQMGTSECCPRGQGKRQDRDWQCCPANQDKRQPGIRLSI